MRIIVHISYNGSVNFIREILLVFFSFFFIRDASIRRAYGKSSWLCHREWLQAEPELQLSPAAATSLKGPHSLSWTLPGAAFANPSLNNWENLGEWENCSPK